MAFDSSANKRKTPPWISRAYFSTGASNLSTRGASKLGSQHATKEVEERLQELQSSTITLYPRYQHTPQARSLRTLQEYVDTNAGDDGAMVPGDTTEGKA
ncbi:hypothetical protein FOPE_12521 [Fonsecaea pedrosoi]|nr:hypothetical protein FOPE_12521 [Fonsecaea pedrosoi]